jgi:hypothetical protein
MASSHAGPVVLTLVRNQNRKDIRTIKLENSSSAEQASGGAGGLTPALMQTAANKFKMKRKDIRLFHEKSGLELLAGCQDSEAAIG